MLLTKQIMFKWMNKYSSYCIDRQTEAVAEPTSYCWKQSKKDLTSLHNTTTINRRQRQKKLQKLEDRNYRRNPGRGSGQQFGTAPQAMHQDLRHQLELALYDNTRYIVQRDEWQAERRS